MNGNLSIRRRQRVKTSLRMSMHAIQISQIVFNILITSEAAAKTMTSVSSGNWNNESSWSPHGIPSSGDDVIISSNQIITLASDHQIHNITIAPNGTFNCISGHSISVSGDVTVNGTMDINGGDIQLLNNNSAFYLGPQSVCKWYPKNNTSSGATLFTKGTENFSPGSTLIIRKWYDYTIPLGQVVSGNFGNLVINTPGGCTSIVEWNQKNSFETKFINGTLTIDQGWVTLDKTGSISSTTIGNIVLTSVNSVLYAHNGTHPSSFTLNTGSITNNGGCFYGLNDGNGNINVNIYGNFTNKGNVKIINNSGFSGVSNGNATLHVGGDFIQDAGDTRIIYNVTTTNSGTFQASFQNLLLNGGIFMGQSACHTGGQINSIFIVKDLSVNFNNASDKFRGNGLTSIGSSLNNAGLGINIGRNLLINGIEQAEFTSSASSGSELINVNGDVIINGCTTNFNYGTSSASHSEELTVNGNFCMNEGTCFLSKNSGTLHSAITGNLIIKGGTLTCKGNSGSTTVSVHGKLLQNGGTLFIHSNPAVTGNDPIRLEVNGTFNQSAGTINFDDNVSGAVHILSIKGDSCLLSGNGLIYRAGSGTTQSYGLISFDKQGKVYYERRGTNHVIDQVCQLVNSQCEVVLKETNAILSSFNATDLYSLIIKKGGKLKMDNSSFASNGLHADCSLFVDSSAEVSINNQTGFAGNGTSAFKNGVNFSLHNESVVEYNGRINQFITGSITSPIAAENKYGILRIALKDLKYISALNDKVFVRTRIELIQGGLNLNDNSLVIENGSADAIVHQKGYIETKIDASGSGSVLTWKSLKEGTHEIPFGINSATYLPVKINLLSGIGNDICISTRSTEKDNLPYPSGAAKFSSDNSFAEEKVIDRWWLLTGNGITADLTLSYSADENTLKPDIAKSNLCGMQWSGTKWNKIDSRNYGVINKTGVVELKNVALKSYIVIASNITTPLFSLNSFDAQKNESEVMLSWETINEPPIAKFLIEKSTDGIQFYEIGELQNHIDPYNLSGYNFSDLQLTNGISYYRIKYMGTENIAFYSETKVVTNFENAKSNSLKINSVSPNPFSSSVKINFSAADEKAFFEIFDSSGKLRMTIPANDTGPTNSTTLNLEQLGKGTYILNIVCNGKKDSVKIIKN